MKKSKPKYGDTPREEFTVREAVVSWDLSTAARNIDAGLDTELLLTIGDELVISGTELSTVVSIAPRTLARRKQEDRLPPDESDRVYRILRIIDLATEVFGSLDNAREWLKEPNYTLAERTPLSYLDTGPGCNLVERTLRQVQHGLTV
jgi:putative toxin-antitoxin system antitoxin component (TIGR02293 family)